MRRQGALRRGDPATHDRGDDDGHHRRSSMTSSIALPAAMPLPIAESTAPHPALRACVSSYVQVALDLQPGASMRHPLCALTGLVIAVLWSGNVAMETTDAEGDIPACCVIGPLTRWHDNVVSGRLRSFCVHFTPLGANTLLRLRASGLGDRAIATCDLLDRSVGADTRGWADEVSHARDFSERVAATDRFLLRRLCRATSGSELVGAAVARMTGDSRRPISMLADELACSERTLRRRFFEELGLSLKRFARITRFQHTHAFLQRAAGVDWATAVARFGYVDQAHLIHEYREFAGTTPTRFRADERFLDSALARR